MNEPAHRLELFGMVITGWPATAILVTLLLSLVAIGFVIGRSSS